MTSPLPRVCSTTELHGHSEKDQEKIFHLFDLWWAELDLNQRRRSQRIYSPPPLTTRASTHLNPQLLMLAQLLRQYKEFFEVGTREI